MPTKNHNTRNVFLLVVVIALLAGGIYYFGGFGQTKSFEGGTCYGYGTSSAEIQMSYHLDASAAPSLINKIAACTPPSTVIQQGSSAIEAIIKRDNPTWTGKMEVLVTSSSYPSYKATLCSKTGTFHCGYNYVQYSSDDCNDYRIPSAGNGEYIFTVYLYPTGQPSFVANDISRSTWSFSCAGAVKSCSYGGKTYPGGQSGGTASPSCLSTRPKYCDSAGQIIDAADVCGCPSGYNTVSGTTCVGTCQEQGHSIVDHCEGNTLWYGATCPSAGAAYVFQTKDCGSSTCTLITDSNNMNTGAGCANQNTPIINSATCTNTCASGYVRTAYPDCYCMSPQNAITCSGTKPINSCDGNTLLANYECSQTTGQWTPAFSFDCGSLNCVDGVCTTPTTPTQPSGPCAGYTLENVPVGTQCQVELQCAASGGTMTQGVCSVTTPSGPCAGYTLENVPAGTQCEVELKCAASGGTMVGGICSVGTGGAGISGGGAVNATCSGDQFSVCADSKTLVKTVCGSNSQWTPIGGIPTDCSLLGLKCIDDTCKAGTVPSCTADTTFKCPSDNKTIILKSCVNGQLILANNICANPKDKPLYCDYNKDDLTCIINAHLLEIGGIAVLVILLLVAVFVYMKTRNPPTMGGKRRRRWF